MQNAPEHDHTSRADTQPEKAAETSVHPRELMVSLVEDATTQLLAELSSHPEQVEIRVPFLANEQHWEIVGTLKRDSNELKFRCAIKSEDETFAAERTVSGTRMQFGPGEVAYVELTFPFNSEQAFVTGMRASRTESPKYFSYALFLQQHQLIRTLIATQPELVQLPKVTGVIIDGATARETTGQFSNWSSRMAEKLGYTEDPNIEGRFTYQYRG